MGATDNPQRAMFVSERGASDEIGLGPLNPLFIFCSSLGPGVTCIVYGNGLVADSNSSQVDEICQVDINLAVPNQPGHDRLIWQPATNRVDRLIWMSSRYTCEDWHHQTVCSDSRSVVCTENRSVIFPLLCLFWGVEGETAYQSFSTVYFDKGCLINL